MKIYQIHQGSKAWHSIRRGKMTASRAQAIAASGRGLETYIYQIVLEKITGISQDSFRGNRHTERGKALESGARVAYAIERGVTVNEVGFVEVDEYVGCSPDGLISDEGGFEAKCLNDVNYHRILNGEVEPDPKHIWQCQMSLLCTERKWWDLAFYNPNFAKSIIVYRILPNPTMQERLRIGISKGKKLIRDLERIAMRRQKI
jgi:hypothetical protein